METTTFIEEFGGFRNESFYSHARGKRFALAEIGNSHPILAEIGNSRPIPITLYKKGSP
ncbi:MAG: hypothetical protein HDS36_02575 [Bacteroides sp.]|nr:hypothetical protein [Bacteroides sp.]